MHYGLVATLFISLLSLAAYGDSVCSVSPCNIDIQFTSGGSIESSAAATLTFGEGGQVHLGNGGSYELGESGESGESGVS